MKRTPLSRTTPIARSAVPLRRSGPRPRSSPLRPRSAKQEALYVERRPLVAALLAERPSCEIAHDGCTGRATDVHELLSRARGGSILDEANCVTACRRCHDHVTQNPAWAEANGWARSRREP